MTSPNRPAVDVHRLLAELESRPLEEQLPADTTHGLLAAAAADHGDRPAIVFLPTGAEGEAAVTVTYRELLERIHRAANLFHALGVEPTGVVSTLLPHRVETHEVFWGAQVAGIVNPVNPLLRAEEIAGLLRSAGTRVLVAAAGDPALRQKVEDVRGAVPELEHVLWISPDGSPADEASDYRRLRDEQPAELAFERAIAGDDVAALFHTGGTTGSPKLARHLHRNEAFTAWACGRLLDLSPEDVVPNGLPMFHVAGTLICGLAFLAAGASVLILSPLGMRSPTIVRRYWHLAEQYGATVLCGVPTALAALNDVPLNGASLDTADLAVTGASPLPLEVGRRFEKITGKPLHEILGMTETAGLATLTPRGCPRVLGSAGYRLPFTQVEIRPFVEGRVEATSCAPGEAGMLVIKGPNVFPGYADPEHRADFTDDGFLVTGDLGHLAEDGRLFLTGRAKDVIIRGGHNIDPAWIEDAAGAHPGVGLAAAVGEPDAYAGELPALFVTPLPGVDLDADEVRAFVHERIAEPPARPKTVIVLDELPTTAVGKPFRPELRRAAAEQRLRRAVDEALETQGGTGGAFEVRVRLDAGGLKVEARHPGDADPDAVESVRRALDAFPLRFEVIASR